MHPNQRYDDEFKTRISSTKMNPMYNAWCQMNARCKPNYEYAHRYIERGIVVCFEWRNNWPNFAKWAKENGYEQGLELDRTDNNKGYSPENCRFVSHKVNSNNRDKIHHAKATSEGKMKKGSPISQIETGTMFRCLTEAAEATGININSICGVLKGRGKTAGGFHWEYL